MKLNVLFAELTKYTGLFAILITLGMGLWRAMLARAERKVAATLLADLSLQTRLGQLAAELAALESGPTYARNFKVKAATLAYEGLLVEACKRAGISPEPQSHYEDIERLRKERALTAAGWAW
ncbi:MAG: hypothetical protein LBB58_00860 [Cellulomonadaceae bacterium]|jgi:hypothetical protein|nr:hypothetical protein [Cellulomonadaceae bacterium]